MSKKIIKYAKRNYYNIIIAVAVSLVAIIGASIVTAAFSAEEQSPSLEAEETIAPAEIEKLEITEPIIEIEPSEPIVADTLEDPLISNEEISIPEYYTYTVVPGDTLSSIAFDHYGERKYYSKIAEDNNISNPNLIMVGQELKIYPIPAYESIPKQEETYIEEVEEEIPLVDEPETYTNTGNTRNYTGEVDTSNMTYLGDYRITGYDPYCTHCCGKCDGITASGRQADIGLSVGCNGLPLGTEVYIEGYGFYRIDDRGSGSPNVKHIDIACNDHAECYTMTAKGIRVYQVN